MKASKLPKPPKYIWNPLTKKLMPNPAIKEKKRTGRRKHRRNLMGCYPGYIFTINGQEYICMDSTDIPRPLNPIPIRIYPTPEKGEERSFLKPIEPPYFY